MSPYHRLRQAIAALLAGAIIFLVWWWFRLFYCWGSKYDANPVLARFEILLCNLRIVAFALFLYCLIVASSLIRQHFFAGDRPIDGALGTSSQRDRLSDRALFFAIATAVLGLIMLFAILFGP